MDYDDEPKVLSWQEDQEKKTVAEKLDGGYVLKTDRQDLSADEIGRTYILLTRVEAAFRATKSLLGERPIFHHLEKRTQTHIFLRVLAYHLLVAIEKRFLDHDVQHVVVDAARTTQHASSDHRGAANRRREHAEDSQSHHPGGDPPRDLLDAEDIGGSHEACQELV